jgi:hypothetical protein
MKLIIKTIIVASILFFLFEKNSQAQKNKKCKLHSLYLDATSNSFEEPKYIVIYIAKDNPKIQEEFCTTVNFLRRAIQIENNIPNSDSGYEKVDSIIRYNFIRSFKFKDTLALKNILYGLYSKEDLKKYKQNLNVREIKKLYKKGELKSKAFCQDKNGVWIDVFEERKQKTMFAHIMFNNGIIMSEGSRTGSVLYFPPKKQ